MHIKDNINLEPVSAQVKALAELACKSSLDNIKKIEVVKNAKRLAPDKLFSCFTADIIKEEVVFVR